MYLKFYLFFFFTLETLINKSKKELQELIKSVIEATQNSNEYLNYVLDQKEQLKMGKYFEYKIYN